MTMITFIENMCLSSKSRDLFGDKDEVISRIDASLIIKKIATLLEHVQKASGKSQLSIAIYLPRTNFYLLSIYGCWVSGNYYTPLNQDWPIEHTLKILTKLKPDLLITDGSVDFASLIQEQGLGLEKTVALRMSNVNDVDMQWKNFPLGDRIWDFEYWKSKESKDTDKNILYIIFTSGSTGDQKGVVIRKNSFVSYIQMCQDRFPRLKECSKVLINGEMTFDISLADIAFSMAHDLEIHLSPESKNILMHLKLIIDRNIDSLYAVPATLSHLYTWAGMRKQINLSHLKVIFSGGDVLNEELVKTAKIHSPNAWVYNMYGPTEVTMNCLSCRVDDLLPSQILNGKLPNGTPFTTVHARLFKDDGFHDDEGELVVSGPQLMEGYLDDEEKNRQSFQVIDGEKYYKTGDQFTYHNGLYYFEDRLDQLVKIKGYRINLNDVAKPLQKIPEVLECRAVSADNFQGEKIIVMFYRTQKNLSANSDEKKRFESSLIEVISQSLPQYMIPHTFVWIKEFPLGKTGKHNLAELRKLAGEILCK